MGSWWQSVCEQDIPEWRARPITPILQTLAEEPPLYGADGGTCLVPVGGVGLPGAVSSHLQAWPVHVPQGSAHSSLACTTHWARQKGSHQGGGVFHAQGWPAELSRWRVGS